MGKSIRENMIRIMCKKKLKVNKMKPLQRKVAVVDGATIYVTE